MTSFEPVRAIQRGLSVLQTVSEHGPVTVNDIAILCSVPQPTAIRLLETLVSEGYVYRTTGQTTYRVTGRTLTLSRGFDARSRLLEFASPLIDRLHIEIGWPSNLAMYDSDSMIIVYSNRASLGLSMPGRMGARLPLLATGVGLVTLAFLTASERRRALDRAALMGGIWDSSSRLLTGLESKLDHVRLSGHAFADEEYLDNIYQSRIWAVAVPIMTKDGKVQAALSSLVLRIAGEQQRLIGTILPRLTATATQIAGLLDKDSG